MNLSPLFDEIIRKMDEVHIRAVEIVRNLSDEQLEGENHMGANVVEMAKSAVITQSVLNPMNIGQISWILKIGGFKFA